MKLHRLLPCLTGLWLLVAGPVLSLDQNKSQPASDEQLLKVKPAAEVSAELEIADSDIGLIQQAKEFVPGRLFLQTLKKLTYYYNLKEEKITAAGGFPISQVSDPLQKGKSFRLVNDISGLQLWRPGQDKTTGRWSASGHILAVNDHDLIESTDDGKTWHLFEKTKGPGTKKYQLGKRNLYLSVLYIAEVAGPDFKTIKNKHIFVGTAYNGLYYSKNGGKTWTKKNKGLPFIKHSRTVAFYEGIRSLAFDARTGTVYAGTEFGRGLYQAPLSGKGNLNFKEIELPSNFSDKKCQIRNIHVGLAALTISGDCKPLTVTTEIKNNQDLGTSFYERYVKFKNGPTSGFEFESKDGNSSYYYNGNYHSTKKPKPFPQELGKDCIGFYVSPTSARKKLKKVKSLLDTGRYNCVVVDVKDDSGRVAAEIDTPLAKKFKTPRPYWKLTPLFKLLSQYKVYKIARMVTFKDTHLYNKDGFSYALKDRYTKKAWVGSKESFERWVNPYNPKVWAYNIELAQKAAEFGFDEIQWDYIRFPSDGAIHRILVEKEHKDIYKSETLASFLAHARAKIKIPISIDIYGYHALYRIGTPIGQNMQLLGEYVDAISPMVYSSHFGDLYLSQGPIKKRAYNLLLHCSYRANTFARGRFRIRNWLQAFKMKIGRWGWGQYYYDGQTQGSFDGGSHGYIWWGPIALFPKTKKK